jgi:hypothetical protein
LQAECNKKLGYAGCKVHTSVAQYWGVLLPFTKSTLDSSQAQAGILARQQNLAERAALQRNVTGSHKESRLAETEHLFNAETFILHDNCDAGHVVMEGQWASQSSHLSRSTPTRPGCG